MLSINILSLIQAYDNLEEENYINFLDYYNIKIKDEEVNDLKSLISILKENTESQNIFHQFYVGYEIPQIGKEFDLLRFGKDCIINIELKSISTEEKIFKQLERNKYYLSFIEKKIYNFSFVSNEKKLYYLNDVDGLIEVELLFLLDLLNKQEIISLDNIDKLFNPSNYLVSPFNSTDRFMKNEYFLTNQQENMKANILTTLKDDSTYKFISLTGNAGTGKTLLTYDIAKEVMSNGEKVLIIHCGNLNNGQYELNSKYNWTISAIKYYTHHKLSDYSLIIIDESQRIYPKQLEAIIEEIKSINGNCIFSYDKLQTLAFWEENRNINQKINEIDSIVKYKLSEKIRTNKEISSFIMVLFDKSKYTKLTKKGNIEINYFKNLNDGKNFFELLNNQGWKIIQFTPSQYTKEYHKNYSLFTTETSHGIIGQEFDKVAVVIDKHFFYDGNKLSYNGTSYYHPVKMLFQNITRTRKKLNIVIIDNNEILDWCVHILK